MALISFPGGLPTPTLMPTGSTWSIASAAHLRAPCSAAFAAITDANAYALWNTANAVWILPDTANSSSTPFPGPAALRVGTPLAFISRLDPAKPDLTVTYNHVSLLNASAVGAGGWCYAHVHDAQWYEAGLKAERVYQLKDAEEKGECEYYGYEAFGGAPAFIVQTSLKDQLTSVYTRWTESLKAYVEKKA
ncbi:hypothetical protein DFJ73DRAFT_775851 [Zopfochytrium polystomum]|nr:hypothetical protein DFJ73DRAFT_775851 [Zopfochytrium polystomum]